MKKLSHMSAHGVGAGRESAQLPSLPSINHAKSASLNKVAAQVKQRGLRRVAGNVFVCPSSKDFWGVKGNKLVRLTSQEVDNGESIAIPSGRSPQDSITQIFDGITF